MKWLRELDDRRLAIGALWALMLASAALNAWGWSVAVPPLLALVLIALVLASEVMGMSLAHRVASLFANRSAAPVRFATAAALFAGVVAFNAFSGHRALDEVEAQRLEPFQAKQSTYQAAVDRVDRLRREHEAARMAVASIPANIPGSRIDILQRPHWETMRRLEPALFEAETELRALREPGQPPVPIGGGAMLAIVLLIEALKALGLWAIGSGKTDAILKMPDTITGKALVERLLAAGQISSGDIASVQANARWRRAATAGNQAAPFGAT